MKTPAPGKYIFHLLYILVYIGFLLQDKAWFSKNNDWTSFLPTFLVHLALMFLLVYTNTLLLIPKLLQKGRVALFVWGILLLVATYTYAKAVYDACMFNTLFDLDPPDTLANHFWGSFVYAVWFTIVSSMLYITQTWYDQKQQVKNIRISQLQNELKYLRLQVNPHFLFNGLNTIYGSIDKKNREARKVLLQFSDLLRYSLYEADTDLVELGKEARHLENYMALQKARSNDNLKIGLELQISDPTLPIAPLLFLPFVENAFKFCTRDDKTENIVGVKLRQKGKGIQFSCVNTYEAKDAAEGGIGLTNVKRRLELLYEGRHTLSIGGADGFFKIELSLLL